MRLRSLGMLIALVLIVLVLAVGVWLFLRLTAPKPEVPFIDRDGYPILPTRRDNTLP